MGFGVVAAVISVGIAVSGAAALARARRAGASDPRRHALLALMPAGAFSVARDGAFLEFNGEAHRMLGYRRDEFAALSLDDLDGAERPGDLGEQLRRAFAGERVELQTTLRTRSGERRDVMLRARRTPGWGRPAVLVTLLDLGARLRTEHALRTAHRAVLALSRCNEALIRSTSEHALFDQLCRIVVEEGGYRMCWIGLAEDDTRRTVRPVAVAGAEEGYLATLDVVWSEREPRGRGPTGSAIRTGKPVVVRDYFADAATGPWREEALRRGFRSGAALPLVSDGRAFGCVCVYSPDADAFDEPELHFLMQLAEDVAFGVVSLRARADRDRLTAQLAQADRLAAMGVLAAGVAHEINNPLAYVMASHAFLAETLAQLRERRADPELAELADALQDAREGCERVRQIVRDLRTFSRVDDARTGPVDLHRALESSLAIARSELKHRAVVTRDLRPVPPVLANEARLGQVFLNLLINAAQSIAPGHPAENEIHVATCTDDLGRAVVEVVDSGPGVPPELRERIFDPFFTTKQVGEGTGLGLSICRNIVQAAGGEITAHPSPTGHGATFRVVLPPAPLGPRPATPAPPTRAVAGRRGRVAVVDDEPAIRRAAERLLASEHDVVAFADARTMAERIRAGERFDAILCDLLMPGMTGIDLHRHLRDVAPAQADAMIFITGGAFTTEGRSFLDGVENPVLEKPFDTPAVRRAIRALVR